MNATQRLFEALTGRSMRLFRPPYLGDAEPTDADEIVPIEIAQKLGYITVGSMSTRSTGSMPPANQIDEAGRASDHDPDPDVRGNIILLHDFGGDRIADQVAAAADADRCAEGEGLQLRAGVGARRLHPRSGDAAAAAGSLMLIADRVGVPDAMAASGQLLYYCSSSPRSASASARLLLLAGLSPVESAAVEMRRRVARRYAGRAAFASVLIPAYNEEKVIAATVERILASDYPNLRSHRDR